jgi:hypothetical protein
MTTAPNAVADTSNTQQQRQQQLAATGGTQQPAAFGSELGTSTSAPGAY